MQASSVLSGQGVGQVVNAGDVGQEDSDTSTWKKTFYYYDCIHGTRYRLVNTTAAVVGGSLAGGVAGVAGAAAVTHFIPHLSGFTNGGSSIFERAVQYAEEFCYQNPVVIGAGLVAVGAGLGAAGAAHLIRSAYQDGLKPRTDEAIRSLMDRLTHQIKRDSQAIKQYKTAIKKNNVLLDASRKSMQAERAENQAKAEAVFNKELQTYNRRAGEVAGELRGYLNALFTNDNRLPTYEESVNGSMQQGRYSLGNTVSHFITNRDYSYRARERLKEALAPYLHEHEFRIVDSILSGFPEKPYVYPRTGPIEREYSAIMYENASKELKVGTLTESVRVIIDRYPILKPDSKGRVKTLNISEFRKFLPD